MTTVKQVPRKPGTANSRPSRAEAKVISPPPYVPELDAYGLKIDGDRVVPAIPCPDLSPAVIMADPKAIVDARLWEGQFDDRTGRLRESQITPRLNREQLIDRYEPNRKAAKLSEADWFSLGGNGGMPTPEGPLTANYVPMIPGPATRQQYWADYWASSAKSFEASTHSGIARRACRAMVQFPLGRGVRWKFEDEKAQDVWEAFWDGNNMRRRLRSIAYDLSVFGEQFLRYFPAKAGDKRLLIIRQLDPATIYEVVTDQEDLETVYFYHQQFQTRMELYSPPTGNKAPEGRTQSGVTRYIIRQIDASEIDHWRINDVSGEARGRSDLFPVLGDLKRLRDLMTAKVIQSDIGTRVLAIVKAKGTAADIARVINQMFPGGQVPAPGSIIGTNTDVEVDPFQYNTAGIREDFTYDELIDSISAGTGIARAYLGLSPAAGAGTTQATALTTVEPSVQSFQERQDMLDELLVEMKKRVMTAAGIDPDTPCQFIFPEITKEDSAQKLNNLEQSEANQWISKKTAAAQAAAELDLTDYDFDEEQKAIVEEFDDAQDTDGQDEMGNDKPAQGGKMRRPMIRATGRQTPKLDPTKAQQGDDEPLGLLVGGPAGAAPGQPGMPGQAPGGGAPATPPAQGGQAADTPPASKNPAAATNNIRWQTRESDPLREWIPFDEWLDHEWTAHPEGGHYTPNAGTGGNVSAGGSGGGSTDHAPDTKPFQLDGGKSKNQGRDTSNAAAQAADYASKAFDQDLNSTQKQALGDYQSTADEGDAGKNLNSLLRSGGSTEPFQELMTSLDEAISHSRTTEPMVVYRGMPSGALAPGDTVTDAGYVSTSLLSATGEYFANDGSYKSPSGNARGAVIEIQVPAGSAAVSMDAAGLGGGLGENEVLLPRGAQFTVERVEDGYSKGVSGGSYSHVILTYRGVGSATPQQPTREADKPPPKTSGKQSISRFVWKPGDIKITRGKTKAKAKAKTRESAGGHLRRTPDDPEYRSHVEGYERETAENLKRLIADLEKEPA